MVVTGTTLKRLRAKSGLTQKELAKLVGVSQAHIAKIEQGKVDPRLSTVNRILQVLTGEEEKKCRDIMTEGVLFAKPDDCIIKVSEVMMRHAVSQIPVFNGKKVVGTITEESIIRNLSSNIANEKVRKIMNPPLPMVSEDTSVNKVREMLEKHQGVLIKRDKEIVGIITRSDILKTIR